MKIESYKRARDLQVGDNVLTSDPDYPQMPILEMKKSKQEGNVLLVFNEDFCADVPEDSFVLMPNSTKMYILQPTHSKL
jgi:hypothetical protein